MLSPCENHESVQLGRSAIHRPGFKVKLYCALDPIGCSIFAQVLPYYTGGFSILITGTSYSSSESLKYHETITLASVLNFPLPSRQHSPLLE